MKAKLMVMLLLILACLSCLGDVEVIDRTPPTPPPPIDPAPVYEVVVPVGTGIEVLKSLIPTLTNGAIRSVTVGVVRDGADVQEGRVTVGAVLSPSQLSACRDHLAPTFGLPHTLSAHPIKSATARQTNGTFSIIIRFAE